MALMNEHKIKNFDELAITPLRKDALGILEAGYGAISTENVIRTQVKIEEDILFVKDKKINLSDYERIFFVGIGKCAADAGVVFEDILGGRITDGIVIDVRGVELKRIRSRVGTHPLPSEVNVEAAKSIKEMLEGATERDLVIALISGGGSALLCLPHDIKCEVLAKITKELMKKGANIEEMNTVRKHLSLIQGGQFAQIAYPAKIISLIFSDVPGDDIATIASGPTVLDTTTKKDAQDVLSKYGVSTDCDLPDCEIIETPKDKKYFENVENVLLLTNETALYAMKEKALELGYVAQIVDTKLQGEARDVGRVLAQNSAPGVCMLYGGETTVTVKGGGSGGRNQELVLGALSCLKKNSIIVAAASDGWDNSPAAGAIGDELVLEKSKEAGLSPEDFLNDNNSYEFFKKVGGAIDTGKTGSNVSDLYFTLSRK